MVYMLTAPQSHEQYYLCVLASNPYGNATHNSAHVTLRDNRVFPNSDGWDSVVQSGTSSEVNVDGKTLMVSRMYHVIERNLTTCQATAQIDQVTDTPTATFTLTWQ